MGCTPGKKSFSDPPLPPLLQLNKVRTHPATEVQPEDHRNALDRKVLQKTPVLAMAQAQTRQRSRKCAKETVDG